MNNYKNFIKLLPGPKSYCKCESICSPITVDHVIPKKFLKSVGRESRVADDLHNLLPCCEKINDDKGSMLFGKEFLFGIDQSNHTGYLSRASLYMYDRYSLPIDRHTVAIWQELDKVYVPDDIEFIRHELIFAKNGIYNPFLMNHVLERDYD